MAEHGLRFDADDRPRHRQGRGPRHTRSGRLALWVIAGAAVYIAWAVS